MPDETQMSEDPEELDTVDRAAISQPDSTEHTSALQQDEVPSEAASEGLPELSIESYGEENRPPVLSYPVVGIGASAGGLAALREILENLSAETGMAFVLVTHLSPDHKSFLSEILERYTRMPVHPVAHGTRPEPNSIYILQPDQRLQLRAGSFHVENRASGGAHPLVIDTFFRSLASEQKNHAVGVVLSGADSDGALGLKAIKAEGGFALVQTPGTAAQPGMPRNSIAADHVDLVVPPDQIAIELGRLAIQFTRPEVRSLEDGVTPPDDEQSFQRILQLLRSSSGLELRQYKPETLRRRLARRLILLRKESLAEYYKFLQIRPDEIRILQEDLLINVTRFFRDTGFWTSIRENVLPALLQDRQPDEPIRVWCAGCSTGEEAYSLAITLIEYLSSRNLDVPIQIFGTDASEQSIETARLAIYPETLIEEVSAERLRRFFVKADRGYQVSKRVRDTCIFARQNLCNDPPFSHIDILSCRNVMIYFNQILQRQVMVTFHYALESGGYMLLGMSEGLRDYSDIFSTVDRKHKIYMKSGASLPHIYDLPRSYALSQTSGLSRSSNTGIQIETNIWPELELQRSADRIVLARFGPPGLIVDERMNVLQSRGQTSTYVELASGGVSWNLLRILKEGIASEARNAVQRSIRENVPTTATATVINEKTGEEVIQIDVLPITSAVARPRCFLVLFQSAKEAAQAKPVDQQGPSTLTADEKDRLIVQLRQDLTSTRFHLQSLVEERDARNQELVSANEEIQSANEELQSTNEELETTKEELQSANEELQTLNEELQQRNNVLTQTGNDLTNLLNSVNIPLLMLTSDLHIRQFTPPMQRLLSVRAADIGRSITEIRLQLSIDDIEPILHDVLETLGTREVEVQDRQGRWYLLRVRPYRTSDNKIEGLVVVLLDIDQLRRSQQHLLEANEFASTVVESVPVPIVVAKQNNEIQTANTAFRELAQLGAKELEGRSLPDLFHLVWGLDSMSERMKMLLESPGSRMELEHDSHTAQNKILSLKGQVLSTDGHKVHLLMVEDITLRREAERVSSRQKEELESEIEKAAFRLSRTKEELRGLTGHLFKVQEEERERIARELHDDVSQRLSLLDIRLASVDTSAADKPLSDQVESARRELQTINTDVSQMSHRLHPAILKDLGLSVALRSLIEEFESREGMPTTFTPGDLPDNLPMDVATAIYRISQEGLRNVAKHAGRTHVKISLDSSGGTLELRLTDFGDGFDPDSKNGASGLGLISMQERARIAGGTCQIQSSSGHGTTITVRIPLDR